MPPNASESAAAAWATANEVEAMTGQPVGPLYTEVGENAVPQKVTRAPRRPCIRDLPVDFARHWNVAGFFTAQNF